ncbi:acyl-CoA dehydrogenase family protein [Rhodococcus sp. P1Y]|uniref:acyl-CoA dehydrogenase family protein n=1 Tax=Rhodococcus sp. P1Y TaxID=1302308 RepID=UPI000EB24C93|nr:acyl-CoA dehydrogenase family protein [Rhodococcus sp. P1Y]AYJ48330.1 acyl-CoA dehydrogenase [Rhodococcus sp. P1Y]
MDFAHTAKVESLRKNLIHFMQNSVIPSEVAAAEHFRSNSDYWGPSPVMARLKPEAREMGLWNLFRAGDENTPGLTNLEYAPLAELTGWSPLIAPEALNCSAPDTGNMELLNRFGTDEQKSTWLEPLLAGDIRSCFSMTEPAVASSDANNVSTLIEDAGSDWVITGRKWWTTGALRPECAVDLVMGVTDPDARQGRRHSIVLVPMDSPGLTVLRSTSVLGYDDRQEGGHGELVFDGVRVPKTNLLGPRGEGFSVAQTRLGPGRIHHCMRLIGMAERAIALMTRRAQERVAFGTPLADKGVVQQWIGEARVNVDAARLLVLRAAWNMDVNGAKAARHDIAAAKIMTPRVAKSVVDNAIQLFGGAGVSQDTTLAMMYSQARFLQIADGPDEVHSRSLARTELAAEPVLSVVR